jgi:hypothetical protein
MQKKLPSFGEQRTISFPGPSDSRERKEPHGVCESDVVGLCGDAGVQLEKLQACCLKLSFHFIERRMLAGSSPPLPPIKASRHSPGPFESFGGPHVASSGILLFAIVLPALSW